MSKIGSPPPDPAEQNRQIWRGLGRFIDRIAPSLFELGVWIFGSLIAFNLLVLSALFTIGPEDLAVKIATAAFALDLPLNLVGLLLLRLVQELKGSGLEGELVRSIQDEGFIDEHIPAPQDIEATLTAIRTKRAAFVLRFSAGDLALSISLTLAGLLATLWHMAGWIAVFFSLMVIFSIVAVIVIIAAAQASAERNKS